MTISVQTTYTEMRGTISTFDLVAHHLSNQNAQINNKLLFEEQQLRCLKHSIFSPEPINSMGIPRMCQLFECAECGMWNVNLCVSVYCQ